jgi:hypothetical protein
MWTHIASRKRNTNQKSPAFSRRSLLRAPTQILPAKLSARDLALKSHLWNVRWGIGPNFVHSNPLWSAHVHTDHIASLRFRALRLHCIPKAIGSGSSQQRRLRCAACSACPAWRTARIPCVSSENR